MIQVVCIDNSIYPQLNIGQVYKAKLIFWLKGEDISPMTWQDNQLNLEGVPEIDWFRTKSFLTLDEWRQRQIDKIL